MCFLCVLLDKDLPAVLYSVQRDLDNIYACGIRDEADNCPWGGWSNGVQVLAGDTVERDGAPVCGLEPVDLHHDRLGGIVHRHIDSPGHFPISTSMSIPW